MDGTLIDTDHANLLAYTTAIEQLTGKRYIGLFCKPVRWTRSMLANVLPGFSEEMYQAIVQLKETLYGQFLKHTHVNKELLPLLQQYSATHTVVLVTNCRVDRAQQILEYHQLTPLFKHFFFRKSSHSGSRINKYEQAIEVLKVSPESVVVFENEESEILDALEAKILLQNINQINIHEKFYN